MTWGLSRIREVGKKKCAFAAITCLAIIGYVVYGRRDPMRALDAIGGEACKGLIEILEPYYAQLKGVVPEDINRDFASYAQMHWKKCGVSPPPASRQGRWDLGVYLLLPEKLESPQPAIIAYTDARGTGARRARTWRDIIVLRGNQLVHLRHQSWRLEEMIGKENMTGRKPDLYYWSRGRK